MPLIDEATQKKRLAELAAMWPETTRKAAFGPGVLVGNWLEDQFQYQRAAADIQHRQSVTDADFQPECPPVDRRDVHQLDLRTLHNYGAGAEMLFSHRGELCENISTTTDLVYNHFVAWGRPPKPAYRFPGFVVRHPEYELMENYGNITRYGLVEHKRNQWADEARMLYTNKSETTMSFTAPPPSALSRVRIALPLALSSSADKNNEAYSNLPLRGRLLRLVPEQKFRVQRRKC